jgi:hypothetical protein
MSDNVILGPSSILGPFDIRLLPSRARPISVMPVPVPAVSVAGGRVEMIFRAPSRQYSLPLLTFFTAAVVITIVSLAGLILAPLYANEKIAISLYSALAFGLGALALTIRRAQIIRERHK